MDSTPFAKLSKPAMEEAAIDDAASLSLPSMMETMHDDISPPVAIDTDKTLSDQASSIIQALQLVQVLYLIFSVIIASFFAIYNIVSFGVLLVAFTCYFGLLWYNVTSSLRTRETAIALAIRSFSVAAVLAFSSIPATYPGTVYYESGTVVLRSMNSITSLSYVTNILLLLVVSVIDWRWNGLFS